MKLKTCALTFIIMISLLFTNFCSIKKMAMNKVANVLTEGNSIVFTGDNDPELVGDALPFAIKMYESLMVSIPWHSGLQLKTGSMYIMYANAFIQTPADMLTDADLDKQKFMLKRAKNLYIRGRNYLLQALDQKHPGFQKNLEAKKFKEALSPMKKEDVPYLYWGALGWLGAFAIDPFDMELGQTVPRASAMMERVRELDPDYDDGSVYDFYVLYYGSMPDYMGGDATKARQNFEKAVQVSHGKRTSPYLSLATSVSIKEQNLKEFTDLLNKALQINPDDDPPNRLANILNQQKASWLLAHADNFFVETGNPDELKEEKKEE
ncbi:MAG: TRAP transporter TatT component family protein [Candidatus Omnitrophota bacterium]